MNSDIKSLLIRVCGTISYLVVIFFFVTYILFLHNDINDALKEAWSVSVAFSSILATIGAAIIAASLFSDWRVLEDHKTKNEHINNAINSFLDFQISIKNRSVQALKINKICLNPTLTFEDKLEILSSINEFQHDLLFFLRSLKIHIQVFATISDNLNLYAEYEAIIDDLEDVTLKKTTFILKSINSASSEELMKLYDDYLYYVAKNLVVDLHSKIIINLSKNAKALT